MFDTIGGLPVHPLAVHATVVLLPLMALVTIAVAARPAWRGAALPVVVADAAVLVAAFVTKESGEKLQARLSALRPDGVQVAHEHGEQGDLLPLFALALLLAAVLVWYAGRRPALMVAAVVVAVVAGVAVVSWTVVVGDSGARAVWGSNSSGT